MDSSLGLQSTSTQEAPAGDGWGEVDLDLDDDLVKAAPPPPDAVKAVPGGLKAASPKSKAPPLPASSAPSVSPHSDSNGVDTPRQSSLSRVSRLSHHRGARPTSPARGQACRAHVLSVAETPAGLARG